MNLDWYMELGPKCKIRTMQCQLCKNTNDSEMTVDASIRQLDSEPCRKDILMIRNLVGTL